MRLHSSAYRDVMRQNLPEYTKTFSVGTLMGLKIEHDESLDEHEWRVGGSHEKVHEVKTSS